MFSYADIDIDADVHLELGLVTIVDGDPSSVVVIDGGFDASLDSNMVTSTTRNTSFTFAAEQVQSLDEREPRPWPDQPQAI